MLIRGKEGVFMSIIVNFADLSKGEPRGVSDREEMSTCLRLSKHIFDEY